jgi:hypothetical protein
LTDVTEAQRQDDFFFLPSTPPLWEDDLRKWLSWDLSLGSFASPTLDLCCELGFGLKPKKITVTKVYSKTCEKQPKWYSEENI